MSVSKVSLNVDYYLCCLDCRKKRALKDTPDVAKWLAKHIEHRLTFINEDIFFNLGDDFKSKSAFNELDRRFSMMNLDNDITRAAVNSWRNGMKESPDINKFVIYIMEKLDKYF